MGDLTSEMAKLQQQVWNLRSLINSLEETFWSLKDRIQAKKDCATESKKQIINEYLLSAEFQDTKNQIIQDFFTRAEDGNTCNFADN
jgi:hypothetical protein